MTRYDMVRLAGNNNPSAQMLMEFEWSPPKQACFSEYRERACSLFTDLHADWESGFSRSAARRLQRKTRRALRRTAQHRLEMPWFWRNYVRMGAPAWRFFQLRRFCIRAARPYRCHVRTRRQLRFARKRICPLRPDCAAWDNKTRCSKDRWKRHNTKIRDNIFIQHLILDNIFFNQIDPLDIRRLRKWVVLETYFGFYYAGYGKVSVGCWQASFGISL